ncbi:MAG: glycosyltransferase family 4 protein [Psychroflexus halocasei]
MILHLANDFAGSKVYQNLISELDKYGVKQIIYTPLRSVKNVDKNRVELKAAGSKIIYSPILNSHMDRALYKLKIKKILRDIETKIDFKTIRGIHAHTWYSDGGVAYELNKKYNIPYMIAIRNTDLNLFWKLPHLKDYGLSILKRASHVILISETYKGRVLNDPKIKPIINSKYKVIPNGIDDYWIRNIEERKETINSIPNLLFIGKFLKGKNVIKLIQAIERIDEQGIACHLNLIGGGGKAESEILKRIKDKKNITYHGKIFDKERLKEFYNNSDIYVMPSKAETFGLVYIEALSQGIPVVFTKNEGIDGLYENNIGEAVDCNSVQSIAEGIKAIIYDYKSYDFQSEAIVANHNWKKIALKYQGIYESITQ